MADDPLATLRRRIEVAIGGRRNAMAFAAASRSAFTRKTLQSWIDGKTTPDVAELLALAEATQRPLNYFLPGNPAAGAAEVVNIPLLTAEAAAGNGRENHNVEAAEYVPWPLAFLRRVGASPESVEFLRATGESMKPAIAPNALLLVSRADTALPPFRRGARPDAGHGDIYVFRQADDVRVKRLRRLARDHLALISDNMEDYPVEVLGPDEARLVKIIGRVVWWDNRL